MRLDPDPILIPLAGINFPPSVDNRMVARIRFLREIKIRSNLVAILRLDPSAIFIPPAGIHFLPIVDYRMVALLAHFNI